MMIDRMMSFAKSFAKVIPSDDDNESQVIEMTKMSFDFDKLNCF